MNDNYPVIVKSYDLTLWYLKKLEKLPKNHRFTIGERIQESLLDLVLILSDAIYSAEDKELQKIYEELKNETYQFGTYKEFVINDNGVTRLISQPSF